MLLGPGRDGALGLGTANGHAARTVHSESDQLSHELRQAQSMPGWKWDIKDGAQDDQMAHMIGVSE